MDSLRHLGRGDVVFATEKRDGAWTLEDDTRMFDASGGPLAQSLMNIAAPSAQSFANISAPGGLETPTRATVEAEVLRRGGENVGGCLWASSGSDANELAIWAVALALFAQDPGQLTFIVRQGGYHGSTLLTRSLSTRSSKSAASNDRSGIVNRVILPEPSFRGGVQSRPAHDYIEELEQLDLEANSVLLLETAPTTGADFWPGAEAYARMMAWCHEHGLPVIFDEVAAGAHRHGWFSAFEWCNMHPPAAVVLGKGLTSGSFPLTCVLLRKDVATVIRDRGVRPPAFTYGLNSDAAAAATLDCFRQSDSLTIGGATNRRQATIGEYADRLRRDDDDLRVENTFTTIRVGVFDRDRAARIRRALCEQGILAYENSTTIEGRGVTFFFARPYSDMSEACASSILSKFNAAVLTR